MNSTLVTALRGVMLLGAIACVGIQIIMVYAAIKTFGESVITFAGPVMVILVLACVQVASIAVWRLLGMLNNDEVFTSRALPLVNVIIAAAAAAAAFFWIFAAVIAPTEIAPGMVLIFGAFGILALGMALVAYVQRELLVRATGFRAELDRVI